MSEINFAKFHGIMMGFDHLRIRCKPRGAEIYTSNTNNIIMTLPVVLGKESYSQTFAEECNLVSWFDYLKVDYDDHFFTISKGVLEELQYMANDDDLVSVICNFKEVDGEPKPYYKIQLVDPVSKWSHVTLDNFDRRRKPTINTTVPSQYNNVPPLVSPTGMVNHILNSAMTKTV